MLPNSLPEALKDKVEFILEQTAERVVTTDPLLPTAFISAGEQLAIVGTPFKTSEEKELSVKAVSELCNRMKADFMIYVLESWMVKITGENAAEVEALKAGQKRVSKHPNKIEVVIFQVETRTKAWLAQGEIKRLPDGTRQMQEVTWFEGGMTEGRFTRILNKLKVVH